MRPFRSYLVCATPRSGSTLLCDDLLNTGIAGRPKEYFEALRKTGLPRRPIEYFESLNSAEIQEILNTHIGGHEDIPIHVGSYADYLRQVLKEGMTPNGVFGTKMMWGYFNDFLSNVRELPEYEETPTAALLEDIFPNLRYIHIIRRDKIRQAVSLWRAIQTSVWRQDEGMSFYKSHHELTFSRVAIEHLIEQIEFHEEAWNRYFSINSISPFTIVYEDFVPTQEETIRAILNYLAIPLSEPFTFTARKMKQQADELSEEWVQQYMQYR